MLRKNGGTGHAGLLPSPLHRQYNSLRRGLFRWSRCGRPPTLGGGVHPLAAGVVAGCPRGGAGAARVERHLPLTHHARLSPRSYPAPRSVPSGRFGRVVGSRSVREPGAIGTHDVDVQPRNACIRRGSPPRATPVGTPWRFKSSHPHPVRVRWFSRSWSTSRSALARKLPAWMCSRSLQRAAARRRRSSSWLPS